MTVEYAPLVVEAKYEPITIDFVQQLLEVDATFSPFIVEASQSELVVVYEVNEQYQKILVSSDGQTEFSLNYAPSVPANLKVFMSPSGVRISDSYYSISGSLLTISPSFPVTLETGESLEIYYY